jgi:filamentous hemagglutinin family protein
MAYQVKLVSPIERESIIRSASAASAKADERDFFEFRNQKTKLKSIRIPAGLPIYRIENCRTYTEQEEYIDRQKKAADFFSASQEKESTQQVQHEILARLATVDRDSVAAILGVLRSEGQREPILITSTGVVVNGNRRLAAMRELYASDSDAFKHFTHVDCMVLPDDATSDEILDIEASLQGKPETKLDYDWIADCQLIKRLGTLGRAPSQIAKQLRRKESDIKNCLQAFNEAQIYLREWAKNEREFVRVRDDGEQFFKDLPKALDGKGQSMENASRAIAWTLFDNRKKLGGRLYSFNSAFGKRAADVMERIGSQLGVENGSPPPSGGSPVDGFAVDVEDASADYSGVLKLIHDPLRKDEVAETIIEICRGVVESEDDRKSGMAAERLIIVAQSRLEEVDLSKASPTTFNTIGKRLDAIAKLAADLKASLDRFQSHRAPPPPADE